MNKKILLLALLIGGLFYNQVAYSQNKEIAKGDESFLYGEYYLAIESYKIAYEKTKDPAVKSELIFKIGTCYRGLSLSKEAELWFKKAIKVKYPDPISVLYYADALKMNGAFEEASTEYQQYGRLVPGDKRAENGVKSCEMSAKWKEKPTRYKVENMALFNSKDQDFCPVFAKKDFKVLYFSSNRAGSTGTNTNTVTGAGFTDLWEAAQDRKGKWAEAAPLVGETINTPDDEGASSLNLKGNVLYFTRCKVVKKMNMGCKLYMAGKRGTSWGEATEITINGVGDSVSVGHPAISDDEMVLFFAAEMQGTYGGRDLWMIKRDKKNGPFNPDPLNLGPEINTAGNEVYPHVRPDGTLYFSSDYHVGMGGLDIFKATKNAQTGKYKVRNMRAPINSSGDDFGIIYEGDTERGFFTSNRPGGKGGDDIYQFYLPPLEFNVSGIVSDCKSENPLAGVKVTLKGTDGSSQEMLSEADGSYKFKLLPGIDYKITSEKAEYLNGIGEETTKGIEENKDFKIDLCLEPIIKPIELPNILYDYAKWDLRPESMVSLDKLVETLNLNPNIVIELGSHTDFRGDVKMNRDLAQKRAESVVNYLIEKGIEPERLVAKGYGEDVPNTVNKTNATLYPNFLKEVDILNEVFIKKLSTVEEQEIAHQINRRTEFKVLRTDYVPKKPIVQPESKPLDVPGEIENDEGY